VLFGWSPLRSESDIKKPAFWSPVDGGRSGHQGAGLPRKFDWCLSQATIRAVDGYRRFPTISGLAPSGLDWCRSRRKMHDHCQQAPIPGRRRRAEPLSTFRLQAVGRISCGKGPEVRQPSAITLRLKRSAASHAARLRDHPASREPTHQFVRRSNDRATGALSSNQRHFGTVPRDIHMRVPFTTVAPPATFRRHA
jgi:hypothetical protein